MKRNSKTKQKLWMFMGILAIAFSCSDDGFKETEIIQDTNTAIVARMDTKKSEKWQMKEDFGFALSSAINESYQLRRLLKEEALKMFNKDYEVLVYLIKDARLESDLTFEDLINSYLGKDQSLQNILRVEPTLTILIPELPLDSFSAEKWNVTSEIPAVAIRTNVTNEVPLITPYGELELMPADVTPGFPVLVVKNNERLVSNIENTDIDKYDTRSVYDKDEIVIKFWANSFDNEFRDGNNTKQRITNYLDPVIIQAYNIYQQQYPNLNGWQRDYIYYGIQPSNPNGPFSYDFQEHIRSFGMTGNAMASYKKISDQTGDPSYKNDHRINSASHWTGGFYEFKVRTIMVSKNGVGNELINGFTLSPDDLFHLEYTIYSKGKSFWKKRYYRFKSISIKPEVHIDLPIINWDLEQYSSSIKIGIEEVDLTTTTVITETRTGEFATNFEVNLNFPFSETVKAGLKFGTSSKTSQTVTVQKTYTEGNDDLGSAIISFGDKVVTKKIGNNKWETRSYIPWYNYCKFSVEPKRVQ